MPDRTKTHGDFTQGSAFTQAVKDLLRKTPNWPTMPAYMREGLDMIEHKIQRITAGDFYFNDHWDDIKGYVDAVMREKAKGPRPSEDPDRAERLKGLGAGPSEERG